MYRRIQHTLVLALASAVFIGCATTDSRDGQRQSETPAPPSSPGITYPLTDGLMPLPPAVSGIDALLASMTLRERIGQRFVVFVPREVGVHRSGADHGVAATAFRDLVKRGRPAGYIIYPWNYRSREDAVALTEKLRSLSRAADDRIDPLIAVDQEGGRVAAFRFAEIVRAPSAAATARYRDPLFVERLAYITGVELRAMGVTMNLAPVLDLEPIADRSIIGDRSWGGDAELVGRLATAYLDGMAQAGVIATPKHFPGHGVTRIDSHGRLPLVSMTRDELNASHRQPFATAIAHGAEALMTAHILFPEIDPDYPVTISEEFLHRMVREELGFGGVVISDGLEMGALADSFDLDLVLERAIRYDVDLILLYTRYDLLSIIERVERLLAAGRITEAMIDRGTRRVLELKARHGLITIDE